MTDSTDLETRMLLAAQPPELDAEVDEWISKLYEGSAGQRGLVSRYWWLRSLFRAAVKNETDVEEMMNETLSKYLGPIKSRLWAAAAGNLIRDEDTLMPAVRWVAEKLGRSAHEVAKECIYENQHQELLDQFYGIDKITQADLEEDWDREQILFEMCDPLRDATIGKPTPGAPVDPERLAYESPKAILNRIANNVLMDHLRKRKAEARSTVRIESLRKPRAKADSNGDEVPIGFDARDESFAMSPDAQLHAQETHDRYVAALCELPALQRAAWILCRDPLMLTDDEAEALLPSELGPRVKGAARVRPLSVEEAAKVFGRDVSPDAAKAAKKLGRLLWPSPSSNG